LTIAQLHTMPQPANVRHIPHSPIPRRLIHSFDHSPFHGGSFTHSIIQSFNHSPFHGGSFNHSIIQSFNHSIIPRSTAAHSLIMKTNTITSLFLALGLSFSAMASDFNAHSKITDDNTAPKGFAVVELFTSEGCSSCPPADKLLAKIQEENAGKPVYLLAFHVDYWNHQGWRDVFSDKEFTKRQYQYANWLNLETVYTPQAVVNGRHELIGSQEETLKRALNSELNAAPVAQLTADAQIQGSKLNLTYQARNAGRSTVLQVALVQKVAHTMVKRGENAGRLLPHVQIVRKIQSFPATASGNAIVTLPEGFNANEWEVITFLQNTQNGAIIAANRPDFKQNS